MLKPLTINVLRVRPQKNWIASFKRVKFSIEDKHRSERPVSVSVPENVDAIHYMLLSHYQISLKRIFEVASYFK